MWFHRYGRIRDSVSRIVPCSGTRNNISSTGGAARMCLGKDIHPITYAIGTAARSGMGWNVETESTVIRLLILSVLSKATRAAVSPPQLWPITFMVVSDGKRLQETWKWLAETTAAKGAPPSSLPALPRDTRLRHKELAYSILPSSLA